MRTACSSSRLGGSPPGTPREQTPRSRHPPPGAETAQRADTSPLPVWTEFFTHAYENITLPQTSFAGGKNPGLTAIEWSEP